MNKRILFIPFLFFSLMFAVNIFAVGVCEKCDVSPDCDQDLICIAGLCQRVGIVHLCPGMQAKTPIDLVRIIISILLFIVLIAIPIVAIWVAVSINTSAGNVEKIKQIRSVIRYMAIGIFILLVMNGMAYLDFDKEDSPDVIPSNDLPIAGARVHDGDGPLSGSTLIIQGNPAYFDCSLSIDPDGSIVNYEWDWESDGTYDWMSGSPVQVPHTYGMVNTYTARLRVTDNDGATGTATVFITVEPSI